MGLSVLDDRDPSIDYSIGWSEAGSPLEFNRTTTWSVVAGSTAKVTFQGTSVGVYGTISAKQRRSIAPVSQYSIDGGAPVEFTPTQAARAQYSQLFFQAPALPDARHTLTITNARADADPLFLDFFLVLDTAADSSATGALPTLSSAVPGSSTATASASATASVSSSSSSSSTVSSTSSIESTSSTSASQTNTVTVTTFDSQSSTSGNSNGVADNANNSASDVGAAKKSNAGAIVGGVFAGIVVLALVVFGIMYWNRKRQRRNSFLDYKAGGSGSYWNRPLDAAATPASIPPPPPQTVEPFTFTAPPPTGPTRPLMSQTDASSLSVASYGQPQPPAHGFAHAQEQSGYAGQGQGQGQGGYMPPTPGPDYYESSDLAYAVNPGPPAAGYGYGYGQNQQGYGQGYGNGNGQRQGYAQNQGYAQYSDSRESDIYAAPVVQPAQQGGGGGYVPPSQLMQQQQRGGGGYYAAQSRGGERVRTRLD